MAIDPVIFYFVRHGEPDNPGVGEWTKKENADIHQEVQYGFLSEYECGVQGLSDAPE